MFFHRFRVLAIFTMHVFLGFFWRAPCSSAKEDTGPGVTAAHNLKRKACRVERRKAVAPIVLDVNRVFRSVKIFSFRWFMAEIVVNPLHSFLPINKTFFSHHTISKTTTSTATTLLLLSLLLLSSPPYLISTSFLLFLLIFLLLLTLLLLLYYLKFFKKQ